MRVYLDTCCLSRLFDVQVQERVRQETGAIREVLSAAQLGELEWVASEVLIEEVEGIQDLTRRAYLRELLGRATMIVGDDGTGSAARRSSSRCGHWCLRRFTHCLRRISRGESFAER
jgi:hypothetical protein